MNIATLISISDAAPIGVVTPGISLSSSSVAENSAQLTTVGAAVPINASNPGAVTITAQEFANLFQMSGDGVTFELGAGFAAANHEVNPTAWVTFEYTDDADTYQFTRTISITDVADGPTITGAATDLETMIGAAETGTLVTGDLGDLFVSPTSQTMTYVVSHGSVAVDGVSWSWTPSSAGATTVEVTATDEDGQSLQIEWVVDVIAANNAPTAADVTLEFVVPEGAAPAIVSSSPTDNATGIGLTVSPTVTFDRDIYFAASGTITLYSVTGAAAVEVFDVATDVGTGDGTISISGDTLTINPTANLTNSVEYAIQWSAGAITNFGGVGVAALTDTTTLSFTTASGAAAPDQFGTGDWSVADDGTNGDITITVTTLPADNGSAITDLEYQLDGGSWVSMAGTTTGDYGVAGLTDGTTYAVAIRAVNAVGAGTASATKNVTPTGVPAAFTAGQWTLTDLTTGGDARIAISALPATNGSAITDLERKIGAGAWTSLGGTGTGNYDLNDLFTDTVSTDVLIRAVNANGNGADSDTKSVTTTTAGGGSLTPVQSVFVTNGGSITIGSGANRMVLAEIHGMCSTSNSNSVAESPTIALTLGGNAMTVIGYEYQPSDRSWVALAYINNPSTGANTLSYTPTPSPQSQLRVVLTEYTGAHQTNAPTEIGSGNNGAGSAASIAATGTTTVNDSILHTAVTMGRRSGLPTAAATVDAGSTLTVATTTGGANFTTCDHSGATKPVATAGSATTTHTWTGGVRIAWIAAEIQAA